LDVHGDPFPLRPSNLERAWGDSTEVARLSRRIRLLPLSVT
jgi:hypothetical protein